MRTVKMGRGYIRYERDRADLEREALLRLARRQAEAMEDAQAAEMAALFPRWEPGKTYQAGERLTDGQGKLYRVAKSHTSRPERTMEGADLLYAPLKTAVQSQADTPEWEQPGASGWHEVKT